MSALVQCRQEEVLNINRKFEELQTQQTLLILAFI